MKLLFLDIYKHSKARISKDTSGGYGTENDLGNGLVGRILTFVIKRSIFWPSLSFTQLLQEFEDRGNSCKYLKIMPNDTIPNQNWDYVFVCSSIVCFETEIAIAKKFITKCKRIFFCGDVGHHLRALIPKECTVISGNYEFFLQYLTKNKLELSDFAKIQSLRVPNGLPEEIGIIDWKREDLPITKHYFYSGRKKFFPFIFTRGCPYSCFEYCTYPLSQGRKILHEDIDAAVAKLKLLSTQYPNAHIVFRDPVFSINVSKAKSLLRKIAEKKLSLTFSLELHLKNIDDEFLCLSRKAKVNLIKFGIESVSEEVRSSVNRYSVSNDFQKSQIEKIKKFGIKTHGMFILAQPSDDIETCNQTINYACELNLDLAQFSIFTPYPGTPIYNKLKYKYGNKRYEDFNQFQLVYEHPKIKNGVARGLLEKAYAKFLLSKLSNIISLRTFIRRFQTDSYN